MTKKILSLVLAALLINLCGVGRVSAAGVQEAADAKAAEKVKQTVVKFGAGRKEFVIVKTRDGGKKASSGRTRPAQRRASPTPRSNRFASLPSRRRA
jgi:hypothetical protein